MRRRALSSPPTPPTNAPTDPLSHPTPTPDFLTQYVNRDKSRPYSHDFRKSAAMAAVGAGLAAPAGLALYRYMDAAWPSAALAVGAGKFTLDQLVGCVIWQAAYCAIPSNDAYRAMLSGLVVAGAGGVDHGVKEAFAYAAAMASSVVLPAPASN